MRSRVSHTSQRPQSIPWIVSKRANPLDSPSLPRLLPSLCLWQIFSHSHTYESISFIRRSALAGDGCSKKHITIRYLLIFFFFWANVNYQFCFGYMFFSSYGLLYMIEIMSDWNFCVNTYTDASGHIISDVPGIIVGSFNFTHPRPGGLIFLLSPDLQILILTSYQKPTSYKNINSHFLHGCGS